MSVMLWQALFASIAGGVISLDRIAAFQIMVSRPIVAGPLVGMLCGSLAAGIIIGALVELLWIGDLPVGGHIPTHETAVVVIAVSVASIMKGSLPEKELFGLAILLAIPFAVVCQRLEEMVRNFNKNYYLKAVESIEGGSASGILRFNITALFTLLLVNISVFFIFIVSGVLGITYVHPLISDKLGAALKGLTLLLPVIGIASVFKTTYGIKGRLAVFFLSFIVVFYIIA